MKKIMILILILVTGIASMGCTDNVEARMEYTKPVKVEYK